ncbi:MAG: ImmA/IrrE family metallo-endopeptidase [Proteobacteria bacterium]|nr:ImmA/IrrE family metallo-endopeptidase [Pseudomonadota bacterium]
MPDFSDFKCDWLNKESIWIEAEHARSKYWPENILPIQSEIVIQGGLGLDIVFLKGLFQVALSNAFLSFDRSKVVIDNYAYNCGRYDDKINFDLAHEIGHYLLHEEVYDYLHNKIKSFDDYLDFMNTAPDSAIRNYEFQASEFAGRFLVPVAELNRQIEIRCDEAIKNGKMDKYAQNTDVFLSVISPEIADIFGVTFTNIEERVKREGMWPPDCLKT